jgi:hypothetical protein
MGSQELSSWLLLYLNRVHDLHTKLYVDKSFFQSSTVEDVFHGITFTVENTLGLLQNISLKTIGIDKIISLKAEDADREMAGGDLAKEFADKM